MYLLLQIPSPPSSKYHNNKASERRVKDGLKTTRSSVFFNEGGGQLKYRLVPTAQERVPNKLLKGRNRQLLRLLQLLPDKILINSVFFFYLYFSSLSLSSQKRSSYFFFHFFYTLFVLVFDDVRSTYQFATC